MADDNLQSTPEDLTGKTFGQYELLRRLGQGGMATVYLAEQKSIGRTVAVKVMPAYFMHGANFLQRFEREVKIISALQHPRVLPVYDYGQVEGQPYIVMAYMSGGTLAERIKQGPVGMDETVKLVDQIAEGLDNAHKKGIIHRDFKPSNVLLDEHGNAYLADFGIAKISESVSQLTGSGIIGTPQYMAPEMAEKGEVSPAVDIYALGITLYQMLTGKLPYSGETPIRVMMAHANDPIPDVREVNPQLSETVSAVVRKAMAKDPADRYAKAGDLARDLHAALAGKPIEAEPFTMGVERKDLPPVEGATPAPTGTPRVEKKAAATAPHPAASPVGLGEPAPAGQPPQISPVGGAAVGEEAAKKGANRSLLIVGGIVGGILLCAACVVGGLVFGGPMIGSLFATPTPVATEATVLVENETGTTICYLYISPNTSDVWGNDWLNGSSIGAGGSYTASGLDPGLWDFRADDCEHNMLVDVRSVTLDVGFNTVPLGEGSASTGGTPGGQDTGGGGEIAIGDTVSGQITSGDYSDSWTFYGQAGDTVTISLVATASGLDPYLWLYGPGGDELETDDDGGSGLNSLIAGFTLPESGTYTIVASRFSGQSGSSSGGYQLTLGYGEAETVGSISYGQTVSGEITELSPEDQWEFQGSSGDVVIITMSPTTSSLIPFVILYDTAGNAVGWDTDSSDQEGNVANLTLTESGTYMIVATAAEGVGGYELTLERGQAEAPRSISYGQTVSGTLTGADPEDRWTFSGSSGDTVVIALNANGNSFDTTLRLLDSNGSELMYDDDGGEGLNSRIEYTLPYSGAFIIVARPLSGSGGYSLSLTRGTSGGSSGGTSGSGGTISYGQTVTGSISNSDYEDRWTFTGSAGDTIIITMTGTTGSLDSYLRLIGPNGQEIATDDDGAGYPNSRLTITLPSNGTYTIVATRFAGANGGSSGGYSLILRRQ